METCAFAFDQPLDSVEHQQLATTAWMGGPDVAVRYWLGRLARRNFFREPHLVVQASLEGYLIVNGFMKGAQLVADHGTWSTFAAFLHHRVEFEAGSAPSLTLRQMAIIEGVLRDPDASDAQLAALARTTEKQVAKFSDATVLRRTWKRMSALSLIDEQLAN